MRRCSCAGLASLTGFGGAAWTGFGSGFFSTGLSSGCGSSVTSVVSGVSRGAAVAVSGAGSRPSRRKASARPARAPAARRRSRMASALQALSSVFGCSVFCSGAVSCLATSTDCGCAVAFCSVCSTSVDLFFRCGRRLHLVLARRRRDAGRRGRAEHDLDRHHLEPDARERRRLAHQDRKQAAVHEQRERRATDAPHPLMRGHCTGRTRQIGRQHNLGRVARVARARARERDDVAGIGRREDCPARSARAGTTAPKSPARSVSLRGRGMTSPMDTVPVIRLRAVTRYTIMRRRSASSARP